MTEEPGSLRDLLPHTEGPRLRAPAPPRRPVTGTQASRTGSFIRRARLPGTWPFPGRWVGE